MRVLSIDLDYIMGPSDYMYQHIGWHNHPLIRWDLFYEISDHKKEELVYDVEKLKFLQKLFFNSIIETRCKNVHFAYEHDSILYHLKDYNSIELLNIDHHDDVLMNDYGYFDTDLKNYESEYSHIQKYNKVDEGCWIGWLNQKNKLKSLTWIGNEDSIADEKNEYISSIVSNYRFIYDDFQKFEIDYKFDCIFVCLSPQYIPPHHWHILNWFIFTYEHFSGNKVDLSKFDSKKFEIDYRYKGVSDEILHQRTNDWKSISG